MAGRRELADDLAQPAPRAWRAAGRPNGTRSPPTPDWIDLAAGQHCGLTTLTAAVRAELDRAVRPVSATLGMTGKHPG